MEMDKYWLSLDCNETRKDRVQFSLPLWPEKTQTEVETVWVGSQALASKAKI